MRHFETASDLGIADSDLLVMLDHQAAAFAWIALSITEVGLRNAIDEQLCRLDARRDRWIHGAGLDKKTGLLDARKVACTSRIRAAVKGKRSDPVFAAAKLASKQGRVRLISRDDLVSRLTFGFWVSVAPRAYPDFALWSRVSDVAGLPYDQGKTAKDICHHALYERNRIAHHQPFLLRQGFVFRTGTYTPYAPADAYSRIYHGIQSIEDSTLALFDIATRFVPGLGTELGFRRTEFIELTDRYRKLVDNARARRGHAAIRPASPPRSAKTT